MASIENRILTSHVYDKIKQMIDEGVLPPGSRINKRELEAMLGVSQTPINDALSRLAGEKFVVQESRRGYFVRSPSTRELVDLFAARAALEGMAARLCAEEAQSEQLEEIASCFADFHFPLSDEEYERYSVNDKHFHNLIVRCSCNSAIIEMSELFGVIIKSNQLGLVRPPSATIDEHRALIAALRARNPQEAQKVMTEHHLRSRDVLKSHLLEEETPEK
ncbi:MAG: GntR family transcriptional regulator [Spirochaetota bacterium]